MSQEQTYATHRRIDPAYHIVLAGLYVAALVLGVITLVRYPGSTLAWWQILVSLGLLIHFLKTRLYPLRAQDRIIRLEERLRMERLLSAELKSRIDELRPGQLVGLRFASDGELAERVKEALDEHLNGEAIKTRIQTWRPDHLRV